MKHLHFVLVVILLSLIGPAALAARPALPADARPGELIIRVRPGTTLFSNAYANGLHAEGLNGLLRRAGVAAARSLGPGSDTYLLQLQASADLTALIGQFSTQPGVVYAEPNYEMTQMLTPNDGVLSQ